MRSKDSFISKSLSSGCCDVVVAVVLAAAGGCGNKGGTRGDGGMAGRKGGWSTSPMALEVGSEKDLARGLNIR